MPWTANQERGRKDGAKLASVVSVAFPRNRLRWMTPRDLLEWGEKNGHLQTRDQIEGELPTEDRDGIDWLFYQAGVLAHLNRVFVFDVYDLIGTKGG